MQITRQRILDYLADHPSGSAKSLARALGKTSANIRHHLAVLQAEGWIQQAGEARVPRRGRPTRLFGLTEKARQPEIHQLASHLWDAFLGTPHSRGRAKRLDRLVSQLLGTRPLPSGPLSSRLFAAVQRLEGLGYDLRWEAHAEAPLIRMRYCPFAALAQDQNSVCELDQLLLSRLLGCTVEQLAQRRSNTVGSGVCLFQLRENSGTIRP